MDSHIRILADWTRCVFGSAKARVCALVADTAVVAILMSVGVLLPGVFYQTVAPFLLASYDYRVSFVTSKQLQDIYSQSFCNGHFTVGPIYSDVSLSKEASSVKCELQVCESFDGIGISCYCDPMILASGPDGLMKQDDSIMVSASVANALHLKLGDSVLLDNDVSYVVARIYESTEYQVRDVALVQFNEYFRAFDEYAAFKVANNSYIRVTDARMAQAYFAKLANETYEDVDPDNPGAAVAMRSDDVKGYTKDLFGIGVVIVSSLLCIAILLIYVVRTSANRMSEKRRFYATLYALGATFQKLEIIMAADALLTALPAIGLAAVVAKRLILPFLTPLLLSWRFLLYVVALFAIAALLSALIAALRSTSRVVKECPSLLNAKDS